MNPNEIAPGDVAGIFSLANTFAGVATTAQDASNTLRSLSTGIDNQVWQGQAAESFKDKASKPPPDLDKLFQSYIDVADALRAHASTVQSLQGQLLAAQGTMREAQSNLELLQASPRPSSDPVSLQTYEYRLSDAHGELRTAQGGIDSIQEEFQASEARLVAALQHAHNEGITNSSWLDVLRELDTVLKYVALVITVLVVIAIVVVLIVGTDGAAFALLGYLATASDVVSGLILTDDASRMKLGDSEVSWGTLGLDSVSLGLSVLGGGALHLLRGADAVAELSSTTVEVTDDSMSIVQLYVRIEGPVKVVLPEVADTADVVEKAAELPWDLYENREFVLSQSSELSKAFSAGWHASDGALRAAQRVFIPAPGLIPVQPVIVR